MLYFNIKLFKIFLCLVCWWYFVLMYFVQFTISRVHTIMNSTISFIPVYPWKRTRQISYLDILIQCGNVNSYTTVYGNPLVGTLSPPDTIICSFSSNTTCNFPGCKQLFVLWIAQCWIHFPKDFSNYRVIHLRLMILFTVYLLNLSILKILFLKLLTTFWGGGGVILS